MLTLSTPVLTSFDGELTVLAVAVLMTLALLSAWIIERRRHSALIARVPIRVHVNGIRGKSTVVRYVAKILRDAGIRTVAKTTGSAARVIDEHGNEVAIERPGAPTILEQLHIIRQYVTPSTDAIVFECMALNPAYQAASETGIIRSTDGVITNVRRDHVEILGETLPEIARSLSNTMPDRGVMFCAENDAEALAVLRAAARSRGTKLELVTERSFEDVDFSSFGPFAFEDNIALALAIADRYDIDRTLAVRAIRATANDPGAARMVEHDIAGRRVYWVNLFGVNDIGSTRDNLDRACRWVGDDPHVVPLVNTRVDRQDRTREFVDYVAETFADRRILLIGDQAQVARGLLSESGVSEARTAIVGIESEDDVDRMIEDVLSAIDDGPVLLVGLANIHTPAAEIIQARLESEGTDAP